MQSVYITGTGSGSGKSVIVLGFMEMLSAVSRKLGFFRPFAPQEHEPDNLTALIRSRYRIQIPIEKMYGCTVETARQLIGGGHYADLLKIILDRFKIIEESCDLVVCAGTDYNGLIPSLEFDFNVDLARNLGCSIVAVVRGFARTPQEAVDALHMAHEQMRERGADLLASVVNGVASEYQERIKARAKDLLTETEMIYVLPEQLALGMPTVGEIRQGLRATCLYGSEDALHQVVTHYKIAAMEIPAFLGYIEDGCLIITPGDRSDIILASLAADVSATFPRVAGLLLTDGLRPAKKVRQLIEGLHRTKVVILQVSTDTFTTARQVDQIEATILPGDHRKLAAALGLFESHVDIEDLRRRIVIRHCDRITPLMFEYELIRRAKFKRQRIVLPEGSDERILRAAEILALRQVVDLILLGNPEQIRRRISELGLKLAEIQIIDPATAPERTSYALKYHELRKHKGISLQMAHDILEDVSYFGTLMVYQGDVDGMVSGAVHTTQHTIRPAFEIIKTQPDAKVISSVFFICLPDRVLVYGDCAVNPNPNAEELADIALTSAATAQLFGIDPKIAFLSYSSGNSGQGEDVERVRQAVHIAHERRPDLKLEGPIQYDAAVDIEVGRVKMPSSEVAGHATVFIFPDLNTGNNTYKAVQRSAGAVAIGPILQGLNKPVNDLSRGCTVTDIINTVAITAIQAQNR